MNTLKTISEIEPRAVWRHFEAISAIPRASKNEEKVVAYMVAFGESLGLNTSEDSIGNVIIRKPASPEKEESPIVVLQGHVDMVHTKTMPSNFDFATQGIELLTEGDWVTANETTLGADNGIGVSLIMAILASNDLHHHPLRHYLPSMRK